MTGAADASVVVGVDESEHSRLALEWAADEARSRASALRIVHAVPIGISRSGRPEPHVDAAARSLADLAAVARGFEGPALTVTTEVVDGLPATVLVEESRSCALLVLGSRGHGGFASVVLGSTAVEVTARADCPVVVVPPATDVRGRFGAVMVGVSSSPGDEPALEFAFARAAQRRSRLVAVQVRDLPTASGGQAALDADHSEAHSAELLERAVAPWQLRFPEVAVDRSSVRGEVVAELAAASGTDTEVVVVGARGRSAVAGVLLGSVSQGLLRHAVVPVVIAR